MKNFKIGNGFSVVFVCFCVLFLTSSVHGLAGNMLQTKKPTDNIKKQKSHLLVGTINLPEGEAAYIDTEVEVGAFSIKNKKPITKCSDTVTIVKGKKGSTYKLEIPEDGNAYGIYYKVGTFDSIPPIYIDKAYLSKEGMMPLGSEAKLENAKMLQLKADQKLNVRILGDNFILGQINKIIADVVKPGMSMFEKEAAIYDYVTDNFTYDYLRAIAAMNGIDNPEQANKGDWKTIFVKKTGVCRDFSALMKILLNKTGIECYRADSVHMEHAWNVVKLNGHYYQLDATAGLGKKDMRIHLNFNDTSWLMGITDMDISRDSREEKFIDYGSFDSFEYNYVFRKYWDTNHLPINQVMYLKGELELPKEAGNEDEDEMMLLQATIGYDTIDEADDFATYLYVPIKAGTHSAKFSIPMVATDKKITLSTFGKTNCSFCEVDPKTGMNDIKVKLEKIQYLKGRVVLPSNMKTFDEDMTIHVFAKVDNGNPQMLDTASETVTSVVLKKGERSVDFIIPVLSKERLLVLFGKLFKGQDLSKPVEMIFYKEKSSTKNYENSTRIKLDENITYELDIDFEGKN